MNERSREELKIMAGQKCSRDGRREKNIRRGRISAGSDKGEKEILWSGAEENRFLLSVLVWKELISAVCFRAQFIP